MSVLKEAAWEAANWQTNLAESFPMLGTTSRDEDDAGSKYFLASPNCVPAAVPPNKVLHSLCFERRPAAKKSVCPIPFHLLSFRSPPCNWQPIFTASKICEGGWRIVFQCQRVIGCRLNLFCGKSRRHATGSHPAQASRVQIFLAPLRNLARAVLTRT